MSKQLNRAFQIAAREPSDAIRFTTEEAKDWAFAEKTLVDHGYCPSCASEKNRVRLMPWEPPTHDTYAGRECPTCESFWRCGPQEVVGLLQPGELETDAAGMCFSDADPGL